MQTTLQNLPEFTRGYILAALFTTDEDAPSGEYTQSGRPDELFPLIDPALLDRMERDCESFKERNETDWRLACEERDAERVGHDFWFTRNGHGAGFWDGDYSDDLGERLTEASKAFGEHDIYFGDDGKIYG
jgi:hypothetical protein